MAKPHADGKVISLLIFFAANPHEELWTRDIIAKTGLAINDIYSTLASYVQAQWLAKKVIPRPAKGRGGSRRVVYIAGPRMLAELGIACDVKPEISEIREQKFHA